MDEETQRKREYPLKFGRSVTNEGGGYNNATGIFACSEPGIYYFVFSLSSSASTCEIYLKKNSNKIAEYDVGGKQIRNSLVLNLVKGDTVSLCQGYCRSSGSESKVFADDSWFSGVMLMSQPF